MSYVLEIEDPSKWIQWTIIGPQLIVHLAFGTSRRWTRVPYLDNGLASNGTRPRDSFKRSLDEILVPRSGNYDVINQKLNFQTSEANLDENGEVKSEDQFIEVEGAIKTNMDDSDHGNFLQKIRN